MAWLPFQKFPIRRGRLLGATIFLLAPGSISSLYGPDGLIWQLSTLIEPLCISGPSLRPSTQPWPPTRDEPSTRPRNQPQNDEPTRYEIRAGSPSSPVCPSTLPRPDEIPWKLLYVMARPKQLWHTHHPAPNTPPSHFSPSKHFKYEQ